MGKILVVDDDKKIRRIYTSLLATEGHQVEEAHCADAANEIIKRGKFDVVLLDIKMPHVDGSIMFEIVQMFHKMSKVIVSSVYPIDEQKRRIMGACDYYDKSQGIDILMAKVGKALK